VHISRPRGETSFHESASCQCFYVCVKSNRQRARHASGRRLCSTPSHGLLIPNAMIAAHRIRLLGLEMRTMQKGVSVEAGRLPANPAASISRFPARNRFESRTPNWVGQLVPRVVQSRSVLDAQRSQRCAACTSAPKPEASSPEAPGVGECAQQPLIAPPQCCLTGAL
jgi:hypothetical protein